MSSEIEKVVKDFLDSFSQHDVDRTISFFSDDCVYRDMALDKTFHGKKELAEFFSQVLKDFPDYKWELISIFLLQIKWRLNLFGAVLMLSAAILKYLHLEILLN